MGGVVILSVGTRKGQDLNVHTRDRGYRQPWRIRGLGSFRILRRGTEL
jgi:hypothetical protein